MSRRADKTAAINIRPRVIQSSGRGLFRTMRPMSDPEAEEIPVCAGASTDRGLIKVSTAHENRKESDYKT